jgi:hypothetical protein
MAAQPYFSIVPCCPAQGTQVTYFNIPPLPIPINTGVYYYDNATPITINGITFEVHQCYTITYQGDSFTNYPDAPPTSDFTRVSTCLDIECGPCGTVEQCYTLYSCEGGRPIIYTTSDLSAYVDGSVKIEGNCYWVTRTIGKCVDPISVTPSAGTDCCDPFCYYVLSGQVFYIDPDGEEHTQFGPVQFCSVIYPIVSEGSDVYGVGDCTEDGCPSYCYELVNCDETIPSLFTTSQTMLPFALTNATVTLVGQEGCWKPEISREKCDCAINLVVNESFAGCPECIGFITYKLTNCTDGSVIYTSSDLSVYVGQTVEIDPCVGCWFVEQLDYQGPSDQPVTVTYVFDSCDICNRGYFLLEDCAGIEPSIITTTDLGSYIGLFITLKWCPDVCWEVSETRDITGFNPTIVFLEGIYSRCPECAIAVLPCKCQTAINSGLTNTLTYYDCDGQEVTITVSSGQRSPKICAKLITSTVFDIVSYGDCIDGACPPLVYPKATIIPGYNTPTCTIDRYEQITCRASEILYKQVLQTRYGISNCCPDDDTRWLLKKEIIDLAALVDPDYICAPSNTCNCPPSNCSCNTCNS